MPAGIMMIYAALGVWTGLLFIALKKGHFWRVALFGVSLMLVLNVGYFVNGAPNAIAFFVGIYDVLDNLGVDSAPALATCPGNSCSVWGDVYQNHPSWGVAFYDRFANGPASRTNLLYGHIAFNSIVFVLMHIQLAKPGGGANASLHKLLGRVSFACLTLGTLCALVLASQHGPVTSYGGSLSTFGFVFMSLCVYGIMLFLLGPLLRNWDSAAILTCIWFSAPLGILIAEWMRKRYARGNAANAQPA